jgi:hypothetical protein
MNVCFMNDAEAREPQLTEVIKKLIADTEHLIEEGRLLAHEMEITRQKLRSLGRKRRPRKPAQRSTPKTAAARKRAG